MLKYGKKERSEWIDVENRYYSPEDYQVNKTSINYERRNRTFSLVHKTKKINKINLLWDELEFLLDDDNDFEVIKRERNKLILKTKRVSSFRNSIIMGKIFGRIIPFNCDMNLTIRDFRSKKPDNDVILYQFDITSTEANLYYEGTLLVRRK